MRCRFAFIIFVFFSCVSFAGAQAKRKIIIDQDARGPATTDQQSMLVFLQSPEVETLGITVVSGDMARRRSGAYAANAGDYRSHRCSRRSGGGFPSY